MQGLADAHPRSAALLVLGVLDPEVEGHVHPVYEPAWHQPSSDSGLLLLAATLHRVIVICNHFERGLSMDPAPRSGCPINQAVEVLGDPWAMLVLRDIMFGDRRHFRALLAGSEEGIAPNILSSRLRRLSDAGLLTRQEARRGQRAAYSLTEAGIRRCRSWWRSARGASPTAAANVACGFVPSCYATAARNSSLVSWTICATCTSAPLGQILALRERPRAPLGLRDRITRVIVPAISTRSGVTADQLTTSPRQLRELPATEPVPAATNPDRATAALRRLGGESVRVRRRTADTVTIGP
ncbi:winged helix-turn-helix transcriptional regulator [Luedemannella flava]